MKLEIALSDEHHHRIGNGGPADPPRATSELDPDRSAGSVSAAPLFTYFAMF
jgi:hypothetical protein